MNILKQQSLCNTDSAFPSTHGLNVSAYRNKSQMYRGLPEAPIRCKKELLLSSGFPLHTALTTSHIAFPFCKENSVSGIFCSLPCYLLQSHAWYDIKCSQTSLVKVLLVAAHLDSIQPLMGIAERREVWRTVAQERLRWSAKEAGAKNASYQHQLTTSVREKFQEGENVTSEEHRMENNGICSSFTDSWSPNLMACF